MVEAGGVPEDPPQRPVAMGPEMIGSKGCRRDGGGFGVGSRKKGKPINKVEWNMDKGCLLNCKLQILYSIASYGRRHEFSSPRFESIRGHGMGTIAPGGTPVVVA